MHAASLVSRDQLYTSGLESGAAQEHNLLRGWEKRETPDPQGPMDNAELSEALPIQKAWPEWVKAGGRGPGQFKEGLSHKHSLDDLGLPIQPDPPYLTLTATSVLLGFFSKATEEESKQNGILQLWRRGLHLRKQNEASVRDVICHLPRSFLFQSFTTWGW